MMLGNFSRIRKARLSPLYITVAVISLFILQFFLYNTASAQTPNPVGTQPTNPIVITVPPRSDEGPSTTPVASAGGVKVNIKITMSSDGKAGTYGPVTVDIYNESGAKVQSVKSGEQETTSTSQASTPVSLSAKFDNIITGKYKICLSGSTTICTTQFSKTAVGDMTAPDLKIPASESDKLFTAGTGASGGGKSSCDVGGVGWIVCPVVNFMASIADMSYDFLINNYLLNTNVEVFNTSGATFKAWSIMRNIANVAFVIAFLIIIFSQLTSAGITNYGIKKLLPKVIIAAVLVNLSFFICQLAVDLSNIVGFSLRGIFDGLSSASGVSSGGGTTWASLAGSVLVAGTAGVVLWAGIGTIIPMLVSVIIGIIMILFILAGRQALVILLIVVSPLAFVAFLLPNTEQWFKKWQQMFTAMLLVFPIVALLYGVSAFASDVITVTFAFAAAQSTASDGSLGTIIVQIIARGIRVIPLFAVPMFLKSSMNAVGNIGTTINGLGSKFGGWSGQKASGLYDNTALARGRALDQAARKDFRDQKFATALTGDRLRDRIRSRAARGIRGNLPWQTAGSQYAAQSLDRTAAAATSQIEEREIANAASTMQMKTGDQMTDIATGKDTTATEPERIAAIRHIMKNGSFEQRSKVVASSHTASDSARASIRDGYFAKGDHQFYGAGLGDKIIEGAGPIDLDAAMRKNIEDGKVSAETLVSDAKATEEMHRVATTATPIAQKQLAQQAKNAYASPTLSGSITGEVDKHLGNIAKL